MVNINNDYTNLSSVMATQSHERTSDRYSFVPTVSVINLLEKNGWEVSSARQTNASSKYQGFQKHMIRFRRSGDEGKVLQVGEIIPEILLTNAHNGGSAFNLMSALFRCWCSNQCVTSDSQIASHRILHKGYTQEKVLEAVYNIVEDTPKVMENVEKFKGISLTDSEQRIFGESAIDILSPLGGDTSKKYNKEVSVNRLLVPKRDQDVEKNLWNTYNIVQEKFLKGDRFMVEESAIGDYYNREYGKKYARGKKTKEVKSIDKDIRLNKALWSLTEKMAELKTA